MLRTALRPRWLGLLVVALVLAVLGVIAGRWQWDVAHSEGRADAVREIQNRPVKPLGEVLDPHDTFPDDGSGQRVTATGHYAKGQRLVVDRRFEGQKVTWVVDRFVVEDGGANLAVVRGWVPKGEAAPEPPSGTIELRGSLAPPEAPSEDAGLPKGSMTSVDISRLVNEWPGSIYTGFAFAISEDGQESAPGLERVPPPLPDTSMKFRNAMYAVQWWMFSTFALWMWLKMVRQAARREDDEAAEAAEEKERVP